MASKRWPLLRGRQLRKTEFERAAASLDRRAAILSHHALAKAHGNDEVIRSLAEIARMLGRANATATLFTLAILVFTAINVGVTYWQIRDNEAAARTELDLEVSDHFYGQEDNRNILEALDYGQPVLTQDGGKVRPAQLDRYLDEFEGIADLYKTHKLTESDFCGDFGYYIVKTHESQEIDRYIARARQGDASLWPGLDAAYFFVEHASDRECGTP